MTDRGKMIEGLETIRKFFSFGLPSKVPVFETYQNILTDTIDLLKEQEEQKTSGAWKFACRNPNYSPFDCSPDSLYECTNCGYTTGSTTKYCPVCGSKNQP